MGPFKCPECGVWWAGFEHRCREPLTVGGSTVWVNPPEPIAPVVIGGTSTVVCTCHEPNVPPTVRRSCPIHELVTYTLGSVVMTNAVAGPQTATPRGVWRT